MPVPPTALTRRSILIPAALLLLGAAVIAWFALARPADPPGAPSEASGAEEGVAELDGGVPVTGLPDQPPDGAGQPPDAAGQPAGRATITVHVAGPVAHPGVLVLPAGARVLDAVEAAGGLLPSAGEQAAAVNLARPLQDGERLDLAAAPAAGGTGPAQEPGQPGAAGPVDVNTATAQQLQELPGVGPVLSERIIAYRQEHGRFGSVDQLQEVPGIGASRLAELAPLVTVGAG